MPLIVRTPGLHVVFAAPGHKALSIGRNFDTVHSLGRSTSELLYIDRDFVCCINSLRTGQVRAHIERLRSRFGDFVYAPHRLGFNPSDPQQVGVLLPLYKGPPLAAIHALPSHQSKLQQEPISGEMRAGWSVNVDCRAVFPNLYRIVLKLHDPSPQ